MNLTQIYNELLMEMPTFTKQGKSVTSTDGIKLKLYTDDEVSPNIMLYVEVKGNFMMAKGWFIAYFTLIENYGDTLTGDSGWLFFPPKAGFNSSPITDIWKGAKKGQTDKIVGACQGWVDHDKKTAYLNMISVRPGYKRNGIANRLVNGLKDTWKGYKFTVSKTTDDGSKFMDARPDAAEFERDTKDYNALG